MIPTNVLIDNIPVFQQIVNYIEEQIIAGKIEEGQRVPSVRELGEMLGVNPNTCIKAYEILTDKKIIEVKRGTGSWVLSAAKERIYSNKSKEFSEKLLPYLILTMKKYRINKDVIINIISELYDDPSFVAKTY